MYSIRSCARVESPLRGRKNGEGVAQLTPDRTPQLTHPTQSMDTGSQVKLCSVLARQETMYQCVYVGDRIDNAGSNRYLQEAT